MRRLAAISAFALLLAVPLWAQHSGGHASGGHAGSSGGHAGFSGGHGGGFSGSHVAGGHVSGGMRSGTSRAFTRPPSSQRAFSSRPFLHDGFRGNRFRDRDRFRTYGYNNCYGYACRGYGYGYGYPWAYSGYYDPYWWWDSSSSSNDDSYNQDVAVAAEMNRENLEEQRMMRQEQADGDQDAYAHSVPPATTRHDAEGGAPVLPDTVLVFRDQHKQEISNYAIVGQTLYNFAPQHTQKIPLSDLDLPATTKANDERGLTFRIPAAGEAQ